MAHSLADNEDSLETRLPPEPAPRTGARYAIEARNLRKVYKASGNQPAKEALKGIDLAIPRGSIFALLGPNGAGKSTFINILAGLVTKTSGSASIWGFDTDVNPRQARASIGVVPQELNIDPFFTPAEVMEMQAGLYGVPKRERRTMEILKAMGLDDKADAYARTLSGGMRRRLLVAKAMVHNPPVLILDEPTAGVDIELRRQLWEYVKGLHARGTTIVLTTHYLEEAEALCDTIAIIDKGQVVACEPKETLLGRISDKRLIVRPATPATQLPAALAGMKAEVRPGGTISVQYNPAETNVMTILGRLSAEGMEIIDISTEESDLEDVFMQLTSH
ncbi:ABC transporter related [Parvibaculum lavamentivorans DS-1]|uniref:ABC transporter related n=1 Tax=Parvibaculum lavamentivorans (strain DS-1 / DSM 13023 / NCIMB 13966) TaxID=402881 RepID=A7HP94_PARL1|nr:ABC transporter ATP-binding protein [Parvibaculum lavamentivorans]ABS61727.1 ABC transporter related [Parvibaculum lavamentivorans DS-1]